MIDISLNHKHLKSLVHLVKHKKIREKTKNGENVPSLEVTEVVLVQYDIVDNQYQRKFEVLYTFTAKKSYGCLLNVEPSNLLFLKTFNTTGFDKIYWSTM